MDFLYCSNINVFVSERNDYLIQFIGKKNCGIITALQEMYVYKITQVVKYCLLAMSKLRLWHQALSAFLTHAVSYVNHITPGLPTFDFSLE